MCLSAGPVTTNGTPHCCTHVLMHHDQLACIRMSVVSEGESKLSILMADDIVCVVPHHPLVWCVYAMSRYVS